MARAPKLANPCLWTSCFRTGWLYTTLSCFSWARPDQVHIHTRLKILKSLYQVTHIAHPQSWYKWLCQALVVQAALMYCERQPNQQVHKPARLKEAAILASQNTALNHISLNQWWKLGEAISTLNIKGGECWFENRLKPGFICIRNANSGWLEHVLGKSCQDEVKERSASYASIQY